MKATSLILCVLFFPLTICRAERCYAGSFRDPKTSKCVKCAPGSTSSQANAPSCRLCFAGSAAFGDGKFPARVCVTCPAGTFSKEGAASCTKCPPGTDSKRGSHDKCVKCGPGTEVNDLMLVPTCKPCEPGFFSDQPSNRECKQCPRGTVSKKGARKCQKCPKGTFGLGFSDRFRKGYPGHETPRCIKCPAGTYGNEEGAISCKICPPGTFSKKGALECTPCPAGEFSPKTLSGRCKKCPGGTSSVGIGAAACKDPDLGCTFDTFEDKKGECRACAPGERLDQVRKTCVPCKSGEVSGGGISTRCMKCPLGRVPATGIEAFDGYACICKPGTFSSVDGVKCIPCAEGRVGVSAFEYDAEVATGAKVFRLIGEWPEIGSVCISCPPNQVTSGPGATDCQRCREDLVFQILGTVRPMCKKCPKGTLSTGNDCLSKKTGCGLGETFEKGRCVLTCPNGFVNRRVVCSVCQPGYFFDPTKKKAKDRCQPCKDKGISQGGVPKKCDPCPAGKVANLDRCICNFGTEEKGGKCVPCKPGSARGPNTYFNFPYTFQEENLDVTCRPCEARSVAAGEGSTECTYCRDGFVANSQRTECLKCPKGSEPGYNVRGDPLDICVPTDPYERNKDFLSKLPGF